MDIIYFRIGFEDWVYGGPEKVYIDSIFKPPLRGNEGLHPPLSSKEGRGQHGQRTAQAWYKLR